ncbi:MAG: nucleotidyl transferase AbiEii/AbiGii toxin family protein [Oscillospiraceae bacterium]|nr:nucleotidyl transferase AbiEii/AbiGii toxin family protein [Oscillospiraceae bacterium]
MKRIATLAPEVRRDLFTNTASKMGMTIAIIEKDFWVCWTLDYLFNRCPWKKHLAFKGGTSLSKAYGLIERFSEDIDLILDWRVLGYRENEPWEPRSNTKQDRFNKEANERAERFLREEFVLAVQADLAAELAVDIQIEPDPDDGQTVLFTYPQEFQDRTILQVIRLEIGALATWTPAAPRLIKSYAAEQYPHLFQEPETSVLTVLPERTFWEKVTILHREAFRPDNSRMPERYSRHYYDLYCMASSWVMDSAFADLDLLARVVAFKEKFYRSPWAEYNLAKPGTMRLMPPRRSMELLRADYTHMQAMIFGDKPTFEAMMGGIAVLEAEINQLMLD